MPTIVGGASESLHNTGMHAAQQAQGGAAILLVDVDVDVETGEAGTEFRITLPMGSPEKQTAP